MGSKIEIISEIKRMRELIGFKDQINEQRRLVFKTETGKIRLTKGEPAKEDYVDFGTYSVVTPQTEWDTFLSEDGNMVKLMDRKSKINWSKLKIDSSHKGYAVASLEKFNNTYPENKWTKVTVGDKTKITSIPVAESETKYPVVPIKFPADMSINSNFFKDNYYSLTDLFIQAVKSDIIDPISSQLSLIPEPTNGTPKAILNSMDVITSSSTLPNGQSPDGKTYSFSELSKLRNDMAKNYVISELQKIGVVVDSKSKIIQDSLGTNKNGTSGPVWNSPGSSKNKSDYLQYKYLDIDLDVIFNRPVAINPIENPGKITTITSDIYKVSFTAPGKLGKSIKVNLPILKLVGSKKRRSRRDSKIAECDFLNRKNK
jgi:hypothetical protein